MKKISLVTVVALTVLLIAAAFPAVSAETIIDEHIAISGDASQIFDHTAKTTSTRNYAYNTIKIREISLYDNLNYIAYQFKVDSAYNVLQYLPEGNNAITYTIDGVVKSGNIHVSYQKNYLGSVIAVDYVIFLYDWDNADMSGPKSVKLNKSLISCRSWCSPSESQLYSMPAYLSDTYGGDFPSMPYNCIIAAYSPWETHLIVSDYDNLMYEVRLTRVFDGEFYVSTLRAIDGDDVISYVNGDLTDIHTYIKKSDVVKFEIEDLKSNIYTYPITSGGSGPTKSIATVYVQNSQTGALLANAHINISASVNGTLHEVVNKTIPSGIYSIELQPTGGGMPNPDFYRLITTVEGYNSIMPHIDFEVDGATTIYAYLDPTGGAPEDENNTFIDFFVRDLSANPISGATVNFGGYTLITNSAGYTIFEVDKNNTYSWTVSKSGYGSVTGNAVIGSSARHTINSVIAPAVTPTTPTAIPTSTPISPTPTMTAPTGEPVSNWLEWFAAHFGMILGGGAEIGKIFMWLCFAVPVGVYVGKEAKAGAAGFMAGAGVVTLFFALIGWVPIWLLVLLALIIGLLYAKVFNNPDNGGGR